MKTAKNEDFAYGDSVYIIEVRNSFIIDEEFNYKGRNPDEALKFTTYTEVGEYLDRLFAEFPIIRTSTKVTRYVMRWSRIDK